MTALPEPVPRPHPDREALMPSILRGWTDEGAYFTETGKLFPADSLSPIEIEIDRVDHYLTMLNDPDQQEEPSP